MICAVLIALIVAQPIDDAAEYVVTAERSRVEPEVIVPAVRTGRVVTVITEEEIRNSGATQVLEVLRDVPGLRVVQTGGGTTSVFSRGGEANFTMVLIDGVKVAQPGGSFDFSQLSTDNVEKIEIVRGPSSYALGGDAGSAVINITTRRGVGDPQYTLFAEGGNFNTAHEGISGTGSTGPVGWTFLLSRYDDKGHLPINNAFGATNFSGRIDLPVSDRTDVTATINHYARTFQVATDAGGDLLPPFFLDPDGDVRSTRNSMGTTINHRVRDNWTAILSLEGFLSTSFSRDPRDTPAETSAFFSEEDQRREAVDLRNDITLGKWDFSLGGSFEREEVHGQRNSTSAGTHFSRVTPSGYLSVTRPITENLLISAGGRYEDNSRLHREIAYGGGIEYLMPRTRTKLRASGGRSFKYPTITQVASQTSTFLPNPDLSAEHEVSGDLGFDQPLFDDKVDLSVTGFWAHTKDVIGNLTVATGVSSPRNLSRIERIGGELGVTWRASRRWTLSANYTYLETEVKDAGPVRNTNFVVGEPVLRRPKHSGNLTIAYAGERRRGNLNLNAVSNSRDRDFSNFQFGQREQRVNNPGYAKLDAHLEYDIRSNLTLTGTGENILDKDFQEAYGFSNRGFGWRAGARWTF